MKMRAIRTFWKALMSWVVGASLAACDVEPFAGNMGAAGNCVPYNGDILLGNGSVCTTGSECSTGFCVDGVCCVSECTETCQACSIAKKGNGKDGSCGPIAVATDPDDECAAGYCNGIGACGQVFSVLPNGAACPSASECVSGHCVDGVCCDTACSDPCMACTVAKMGAGTDGVCGMIAAMTDPDNECSAGSCNGLGACGGSNLGNGSACTGGWECSSGFCTDGICCDVACIGTCMACTAAKKGAGTNGVCGPIAAMTDPDDECMPGECNGTGACPVINGPPCNQSQCCGLPVPTDIGTAQGLIDIGHFIALQRLIQSGDRVLSQDRVNDRWILWDTTTLTAVTSGLSSSSNYVGIAGNLVVIQTATGLNLRSATTGQLQATVSGAPNTIAQLGIADDGSYVWAALTGGGLKAWSAQGAVVLDVMGDYSNASLFAAPLEIRVAKGPAGTNRIETLPLGGGPSTLSPTFSQKFHSWMVDGERFFAVVDNAVSIYSKNAALVTSAALPTIESLGGTGNRFWTFQGSTPGYPLRIYDTNSGATPIATYGYGLYTELFPSKQGLGVIPYADPEIHFIHLDALATRKVIPLPFKYSTHIAIDSMTGFWTVSNNAGVIYQQGTSQNPQAQGTLGCGAVLEIAGTPTGWAAIALASKRLLILDMNAGGVVEKVLPIYADKVKISNDGSVLVAWSERYQPKWQVGVYSLPAGNQIHNFSYSSDFAMSSTGQWLGLTSYPVKTRQVTNINGTATFFGDDWTIKPPPLPSPNGAHIAAPDGKDIPKMGTNLYLANPMGGKPTFINAVPGAVTGWIDDNRMLAYTVKIVDIGFPPTPVAAYHKTFIYDPQGNVVASPPIPVKLDEFDVVSASTVYSPHERKMYDLTTGATSWTSPLAGTMSHAAGNQVIMEYKGAVYVVPF